MHWSARNHSSHKIAVTVPFMAQLSERLKSHSLDEASMDMKIPISKALKILRGDIFPTLAECLRLTRALGLSFTMVALPHNEEKYGPINPEVLKILWEKAGRPTNMFELESLKITRSLDP